MEFKYFSRNGDIRPIEEAHIPLSNIAYQYGFGVYETIRVENNEALFLADHIERLHESARIIGLTHPFADIERNVAALIEALQGDTYNLKILLIGGDKPELYITASNPLFPDKKLYRDGVHCILYEYERPFPHAKTLNMLQSYLAYKAAWEAGAYDALLLDRDGCIREGTRTNFFAMKGKTLYSPPQEKILLGVTRKVALKVAKENGYEIIEKDISLDSLSEYDGAFLTSTSTGIMPIKSVDSHSFEPFDESMITLIRAFDTYALKSSRKR